MVQPGKDREEQGGRERADVSVDLQNAELSTAEAEELARLMRLCPKLTCLDVRGNEKMEEEGVKALRSAIFELTTADGRPRSLCGLAPDKSTLTVPRNLGHFEAMMIAAELSSSTFAESQVNIKTLTLNLNPALTPTL